MNERHERRFGMAETLVFCAAVLLGGCGGPHGETGEGSTRNESNSTTFSEATASSDPSSTTSSVGASSETTDAGAGAPGGTTSEHTGDADVDGTTAVRIATWNIQGLGTPESPQYEAAFDILQRLDADIVGLNEIDAGDLDALSEFGSRLGYAYVLVPPANPFGTLRNAILSRLPPDDQTIWTAAALSGDPGANDVTRNPLSMTVTTEHGTPLTLVVQHWNSGFGDGEEFLRAIDGVRVAQVAARARGAFVVVGDVNAELGDVEVPSVFTEIPRPIANLGALLGSDIEAELSTTGLQNDAFAPLLEDLGMEALPLTQADGNEATRDVSGRRIDYILVSGPIYQRAWVGEVYDAEDDLLSDFEYMGSAPSAEATEIASDHFPLVADIAVD